ncbi:MAG TPA: Npt1/Npt2 family nucleotide transporter [Terriglobales bacterium]
MLRWLERVLNLRPGDLGRGLLLCSCLFLIITSYVVGKVAGDALFLAHFEARQLAYADVCSAFLVMGVIAAYVRFARRLSVLSLLVASMLFFSSNCGLFWVLARSYRAAWLYPVFYMWVKVFGVLAPAQVWTLANYVLTTREAKRVFGLVGGGAISGWIFAGFFCRTIAKLFGTESLLLGMTVFLALCAGLVVLAWQSGRVRVGSGQEVSPAADDAPRNLWQSVARVFSSPYLRAIAGVICVSNLVTNLTMWQFRAIAQQVLVRKDALAVFFGNFNLYAGAVALVFQLLITTRLLRRFGIGKALFVLPFAILAGSVGLLAVGTLAAVVLLKGTDQVLRYSLDKSTAELLYLPLPSRVKLHVKWFIDTVVWRMGDTLAGLSVLIFATWLHLPAVQLSWVVLAWVGCWLFAVYVAKQRYVVTLNDSVTQHRLELEQISAPVLDRQTFDVLAAKLAAPDPNEIIYALGLFEAERERAVHPVIRGLLEHPAAQVRHKALSILSDSGDKAVLPQVEKLVQDPDLLVRTDALLYLSHHAHVDPLTRIQDLGDFPDFSVRSAMVAFLARPGEAQNLEAAHHILEAMVNEKGEEGRRTRVEAAHLLGLLPDTFDPLLASLLADPEAEVVSEAIRSAGMLRKRRLVPVLIERLGDPALAEVAADALARFGDSIIGALCDHIGDASVSIGVRREIPPVLVRIGTPAAARALGESMLQSDARLRFRIISSLNKLHRQHPEIATDVMMLETVLGAEIMGHYRSYQILHLLGPAMETDGSVANALKESMQQELERIFRILGLLYPNLDVHAAYLGLQSKNITVHDNALEFVDNVIKLQIREILVPLLDGRVTISERVKIAKRLVHSSIDSQEQAVMTLLGSEDSWLQSCGAYAVGMLRLKTLERELDRCLQHGDALLRETARTAKQRLEQAQSASG